MLRSTRASREVPKVTGHNDRENISVWELSVKNQGYTSNNLIFAHGHSDML